MVNAIEIALTTAEQHSAFVADALRSRKQVVAIGKVIDGAAFSDYLKAKARGVKVFHLNIGQPDLETPKAMRDRLLSVDPVIAYSPSAGTPKYLDAMCGYYATVGLKVEPENLIWLQWDQKGVEDHCRSVEKAGEHFHPWGMAEENRAIYLCRGLRHTIAEYWIPDFKHWN